MNRRLVLMGISAATPVLAAASIRSADAQDTTLGLLGYRKDTLQLGTLSLQTSQLALERARDPHVKEFAGFESAEQTTIAQVLTDEQKPKPPALTSSNAAILARLQQTQAGPDFDREFVTAQLQAHQELYRIQESFLNGAGTMSADSVHVAMLARTVIQMHLTMLQELQNVLHA